VTYQFPSDTCTPILHRAARVVDIVQENHRTRTFTLDMHLPNAYPGQFVMVWLPGINEKPLSLMDNAPVRFTVAAVGPFTRALHQVPVGGRVWVRGPFGRGFTLHGHHIVVVGGGYGVAPLHFLTRQALNQGMKVTAIIGARMKKDLLFEDRFRALGIPTFVTTDDGSYGRQGVVTDLLHPLLERSTQKVDEVYACGPEPMLLAVRELCMHYRVPAQLSWVRVMRCGMGICGSCARDGWLVCRDGPVERVYT